MADLLLQGLEPRDILALGDAAARIGKSTLARNLYNHVAQRNPHAMAAWSRLALLDHPRPRTLPMLDALNALEKIGKPAQSPAVYVGEGLATWLKTAPFAGDERFLEIANQHADLSSGITGGWHWNLYTVAWAVQRAKDLAGDFVELGVFKGHTTSFVANYVGFAEWPKRWWLYDTFDGIPDDQLDPGWAGPNENQYRGTFSFEEVRDRFAAFPNITVTKGRVPEVLETVCPEAISFLHIDMNNVTAETAALEALYDRITPGGVIVFDDFGWLSAQAQREAETAWFAAKGQSVLSLPTGQGLFIKP
ncbi:MAG TPA: TylF/MycF/NovP-related O-methyltransferase [Phenylobacterium sp.]